VDIAVIIPFHDQHVVLDRCLESIRRQSTAASVSVFIVDDGSKQPLLEAVKQYVRLPFEKNHGVQHARNNGWLYAKYGLPSYVLFCDADVFWYPNAFQDFLDALEANPDAAYAYGDYDRYGVFEGRFSAGPFSDVRLRHANFVTTMSMIRFQCIPEVPFIEDEERLQDWSLWLRLLNAGHRGIYTEKVMFNTGFTKDSVSSRGPEDYAFWRDKMRSRYVSGC